MGDAIMEIVGAAGAHAVKARFDAPKKEEQK
jgi:hypothetical protein